MSKRQTFQGHLHASIFTTNLHSRSIPNKEHLNKPYLVKIMKILFRIFFKEWGTTYFTFEEDPEPFGRVRDQNIVAMCKEMNIAVSHEHSHTLYNLEKYEFFDEAETRRYVMY